MRHWRALPGINLVAIMRGMAEWTLTMVLPTFNERDNIRPLIEGILGMARCPTQVLVVDDDSADGTWQVVAEMAEADPRVHLLRRTDVRGLTSAIAAGIARADTVLVGWMDCDLSMPPERVADLVDAVARGADIAIGSRYVPGGRDEGHSWMGRAFSRAINLFAALLLGWQVRDYTSGFVVARKNVFDRISLRGDYGEYCIDLLARAQWMGYRIAEVPYICQERRSGKSKTATSFWGYLRRGRKYVAMVLRLWRERNHEGTKGREG
jgi:dolichol-phosphate mannosyltransferase